MRGGTRFKLKSEVLNQNQCQSSRLVPQRSQKISESTVVIGTKNVSRGLRPTDVNRMTMSRLVVQAYVTMTRLIVMENSLIKTIV